MKKEEIISTVFNEKPLSFQYIPTGLTNDNYIVTLESQIVVLRIPRVENEGLFDYALESKVLELIKPLELDTQLLYYNKDLGIKCNAYAKNAETYSHQYLLRAAKLIKKLHSANLKAGKTFDVKEKFHQYKERIINPIYDTEFAHHYIDDIKLENICLCHNDLVEGNLLFSDQKDYLIDYEYASDNDPFFDVMSFLTENDIVCQSKRACFYDIYFGRQPTSLEQERLDNFEIVHHVLWCEWAMMMYEQNQERIYQEIADLKYKRLCEAYSKKNNV